MSEFMTRVLRRETHSPRSGLSVVAAILVTLAAIYALLEAVLAALGQPTWLVHPLAAAQWIADLPGSYPPALLGAAGVLMALVGLIFLGTGLLPGRRARHVIANPRVAIVVDDEVIASALAKSARMAAGVTREQVMVVVSARLVQVNIRPTSGIRLSEQAIQAAVEAQLAAMELDPRPAVTVKLAASGVVGV
ncbi:MAG: hypothetical protein ABI563_07520 [Specibacter sp.]